NSTNFSGTKEAAGQDVKKDVSSLRYIFLPNWFHEAHLEYSTSNAQDTCSAVAPESSGISNPTATSTNPPADHIKTLALYEESSSQVPEGSGNPNPTASAFNPLADQMETLTVESPISTVSSPVQTTCLNDSSEPSSKARLVSKRVANQEETP
nr:hypothetical protein [Tanacetum cinerariifolium]